VSAIAVVTIHATGAFVSRPEQTGEYGASYWLALTANQAARCAVPVFFAIAGWVLLSRGDQDNETAWLRRRMARLLVPLVVWNLIFVVDAWVIAQINGVRLWEATEGPGGWLWEEASAALWGPGTRIHLWFMYYLVALTLALWLLRVAPKSAEGEMTRLAVGTAAAMLIVPFSLAAALRTNLSWASFGWAIGYAVIGYVMLSLPAPRRWISAAVYVGATFGLVVAEQLIGFYQWPMIETSPLILLQTLGLIGLVRSVRLPESWKPRVIAAARLTFGVYLVHLIFLDAVRLILARTDTSLLLALTMNWLVPVVCSFGVVALWHRSQTIGRLLG